MNLGFSAFVMQGGRSGIATYIRGLLHALQKENSDDRIDILMTRSEADLIPVTNPNFTKKLYSNCIGPPVLNLAWHNMGLPQKQYDVLHIPSYRRIPLLKRTPIVATVHDLATLSVADKYDPARMFFNRRMVPPMIRRADHVIAISESTKHDLVRLVRYPEDRISVVYPGIDHELFRPLPKDEARRRMAHRHGIEKPFFVYISRLEHPAKNHLRLIEAFERFKLENDSSHQLVLAGADWNGAQAIRERAANSPVHEDIVFPGFVPAASLPLLYSGCDLMIYPSLFEGFGLPIIEALACGAKVVCSDTSSMKEIARNLIPTFDPHHAECIFRSMEDALSEGSRADIRARGMEYARTFNWRDHARNTMKIYRSVSKS